MEESDTFGTEHVTGNLLIYLNRLSDYLFMLARYLNQTTGVPEIPWNKSNCR
jgi:cob(I)alamin adenosyltransferase